MPSKSSRTTSVTTFATDERKARRFGVTSSARSMPHSLDSTSPNASVAGEAHERPAVGEVDEADEVVVADACARSVHQRAGGSGGPEEQPLADAEPISRTSSST